MGLDLQALDTKIRRLQKLRDLLSDDDTRELLSDPETLVLIQQSRNGNGTRVAVTADDDSREIVDDDATSTMPAEGSFRRKVLDIARACPNKFDARYVFGKLEAANHHFDASEPMIAVNTALRALHRKDLIRLVRAGSGRAPHIYEAMQKGEPQK